MPHALRLVVVAILLLLAAPANAAEKVSLQLSWHHQFQFAGYYAAKKNGFYRDAGLDVTIVAGKPGRGPVKEVLAGRAHYGTASLQVLLAKLRGEPVVALAAIFQHSPVVFMARRDSGIRSPQDLVGRTVMTVGGRPDFRLLEILRKEGVDPGKVNLVKRSFDIDDLVEGKIDATTAYLTNEPYFMQQKGIPVTILDPATYGIDFYSDILFTTEDEIENHPDRVKRFREASLRGWKYAMANHEEIIDLIRAEYGSKKTRDHLRFEADAMRALILPGQVETGHMNPGRWKHMADTIEKGGMIEPGYSLEGFIYDPKTAHDGPLVFLGDKNYPPYEFFRDGKPVGANVEFLNALGKALERPVEVRLYQWPNAQARFNNGEGHGLTFSTINDKRRKLYDFTQPTFTFKFSVFTTTNLVARFNVDDFSDKRIAVKRGGGPRSIMETSHPEAELVFVDNVLEGFRLLLKGDVDGVIEDKLVGEYTLRENNIGGIDALSKPVATRTAHIAVTKDNTALLGELSRAITELKLKGELNRILRRWSGIAVARPIQIVVGSGRNFPPYAFAGEDGQADGFSVDLMKAVCEVMGIDVVFRLGSWPENTSALKVGEIDALPLVARSKVNEERFDITSPHISFSAVVFKRGDSAAVNSAEDLRGKEIIVPEASTPHDYLVREGITDRLVLTKSLPEALRLLSSGKHDYAMTARLVSLILIKDLGLTNLAVTGPRFDIYGGGFGFAVKDGNTELLSLFDQGLNIIKQTGRYDEIYEKWFGLIDPKGVPTDVIIGYLAWGMAGVIILVGLPLGWSVLLRRKVKQRTIELHEEIADRKQAEKTIKASLGEKEVLLREVHHRVKNNLQVISSMLSLQARTETDNPSIKALEESQRRIKVMARIHETLHQSDDLTSIDARDYLSTVVEDTLASGADDGQRISPDLDVDDIILDADHAVACGQIVSELLSNSRKHAFPNGQSGNIEVSVHRADGGKIELTVADNGQGLPDDFDHKQAETLGMRLVHALATQLSGVVKIDGSGGTRVQIIFPGNPS